MPNKNAQSTKFIIFSIFFLLVVIPSVSALTAIIEVNEDPWYTARKVSTYGSTELTSFYEPFPVFFEGWKSTPRDEIVKYEWDYGDGSVNTTGFNGAHIYLIPGVYNATLKITNSSGDIDYDEIEITVTARDGTKYYVDSAIGDDNCDGKFEFDEGGTNCPWETAGKAFSGMGATSTTGIYNPGDEILFRSGQTFYYSATTSPGHGRAGYGYVFRSNGTGAKPIIRPTDGFNYALLYQTGNGLAHFGIINLDFRQANNGGKAGEVFGFTKEFTNVIFLNNSFRRITRSVNVQGDVVLDAKSGMFFFDNFVHNSSNSGFGYNGARLAMINNVFNLSNNHHVYANFVDKGLFLNNTFKHAAFGRESFRISAQRYQYEDWLPSNNIVIADNTWDGWIDPLTVGSTHGGGGTRYNIALVHIGPNTWENQSIQNIIFERNKVNNGEIGMYVSDAENITIKNNIFMSNSTYAESTLLYIGDEPHKADFRPTKNVQIYGNTFIARDNMQSLIRVINFTTSHDNPFGQNHENITIKNNIFYIYDFNDADATDIIGFEHSDIVDITNIGFLNNFTFDNNLYYIDGGSEADLDFYWGGTTYSFSEWQSLTGGDANSLFGDPAFTSILGVDNIFSESNFHDYDLTLTVLSAARDMGANLFIALYHDFIGLLRASYGDMDAGAYEFQDIPDENAPTFDHVLANFTIAESVAFGYDINATDDKNFDNFAVNDTTNFAINQSGWLYNATVLSTGTFELEIKINDTLSNNATSYMKVVVSADSINPSFTHDFADFSQESGLSFGWNINATDNSGTVFYAVNDSTNFEINTTGWLKNKITLPTGNYSVNVSIADPVGNGNSSIFSLNITGDTSVPTYVNNTPLNASAHNVGDGVPINFTITDASGVPLIVEVFGFNDTSQSESDKFLIYKELEHSTGDEVIYNWTSLPTQPNDDTLVLYHFDNRSTYAESNILIYDFTDNGNNGTIFDTTFAQGKMGWGASFDETNDYINISDFGETFYNMTMSFWFKIDDNSGNAFQYIFSWGTVSTTNTTNVWFVENGVEGLPDYMRTKILDSDDATTTSLDFNASSIIGDGEWHLYSLVKNSTGATVYLDGVLKATNTSIATGDINLYNTVAGNMVHLGARNDFDANRFYGGLMDDFVVINDSITPARITDIYQMKATDYRWNATVSDGTNINATELWGITLSDSGDDVTSPVVSIVLPDSTNKDIKPFEINYTATDETALYSCWFTNDTGLTNTSRQVCGTNWTGLSVEEGSATWTVYANDSSNNLGSDSVTFFVDTITPDINLTYPLNTTYTTEVISIEYTLSDTNIDECWYSIDLGLSNDTTICGDEINLAGEEGSSTWIVWTNDSVGNTNSSNVTFFVDSLLPTINITYPINTSYTSTTHAINYTVSDTNYQACWYTNDTGLINYTITCGNNVTEQTLALGTHTYTIYSNDTLNNIGSYSVKFTIISTSGPGGGGSTIIDDTLDTVEESLPEVLRGPFKFVREYLIFFIIFGVIGFIIWRSGK